jgi:translation initiation factor 2-alpha kinase 4
MPPEALDHPLEYPISRDIWCAGVILVQMLRGFDVINRFDDWESAVDSGWSFTWIIFAFH